MRVQRSQKRLSGDQQQPLNAIAKARQLALLIMDLYQAQGVEFQPFEAFSHERDFYAQVGDAEQWRVPHGKNEVLMQTMGVTTRQSLSIYRELLNSWIWVWVAADDYHLTIEAIRSLNRLSEEEAAQIVKSFDNLHSLPNSGQAGATQQSIPQLLKEGQIPRWKKAIESSFTVNRWKKMPAEERRSAYDYLRVLIQQMEEMGFED